MAKHQSVSTKSKARGAAAEAQRRSDLVDELGPIQARLKPDKKREAEIVAEIRAWTDAEAKPGETKLYEGRKYVAPVTAKPNKRSIPFLSRLKILALLGKEKFCEICGITLENAEKTLAPAQLAGLVEEEPNSGTRTVTTVLRPAESARKRAA